MSKPLTQADYAMTPETARERALLIAAQDADAPKLTDRIDAEAMRVLVASLDEARASLAAAEARALTTEEYQRAEQGWREQIARANAARAAAEAKLAEWKNGAVNDACGDALELLWRDVILASKPNYGPWEYPGQAYRHLLAEFNDMKAKLADERKLADELAHSLMKEAAQTGEGCFFASTEVVIADHNARRAKEAAGE